MSTLLFVHLNYNFSVVPDYSGIEACMSESCSDLETNCVLSSNVYLSNLNNVSFVSSTVQMLFFG